MKNFSSTTAHAASANSKVRNNVFNGMHLRDGKLYSSANGKYPLMSGVDKVSVGTRFNRIFMTDGTTYVYTPDWKLVSFEAQHSVSVGGYYVSSVEELEVNADFQLVKGHRLKVADANGMVVHENVRGFLPLNERFHLIRYESGGWMLCERCGAPARGRCFKKANLSEGRRCLFFDERGKMHLNMWDAHCYDILHF